MAMRSHELHPALVHYPLALLPAAAVVDAMAAARPRSRGLDSAGAALWWATAGSGLLAGLAGMAASQQVETRSDHARDRMFLHGIGNFGLVLAAFGVASWRTRHRASGLVAGVGAAATFAAMYTAYLGGELVYADGVGVKALGGVAAEQPGLASGAGARALVVDAGRGLGWLLRRAGQAITGKAKRSRAALEEGVAEAAPVH